MNDREYLMGVSGGTPKIPKRFRASKLVIPGLGVLIAVGISSAVAYQFGKSSSGDGSRDDRQPAPLAPKTSAPPAPNSEATPPQTPAPRPVIVRELMIGIWAPAEGGCAQGYGMSLSPNGRYAIGDEASGEEGKWRISDDRLTPRTNLEFSTVYDEESSRRTVGVDTTAVGRVTWLDRDELTMVFGQTKSRWVKCNSGQHMFEDGELFKG